MGNWIYVAISFGLTWAVLGLYITALARRALRAGAALQALESAGPSDAPW